MASASSTRQWRSTSTKLRRVDLAAIKDDCEADEFQLPKKSTSKGPKQKSRKTLRKEKRQRDKAKHFASWMKKRGIEVKPAEEKDNVKKKKSRKRKRKKPDKLNEGDEGSSSFNAKDLLSANEQEDKIIAKLEKKLGMKKKKNLPKKFKEDGFDYLLQLCEPIDNPALFMQDDDYDNSDNKDTAIDEEEADSENEPDVMGSKPKKRRVKEKEDWHAKVEKGVKITGHEKLQHVDKKVIESKYLNKGIIKENESELNDFDDDVMKGDNESFGSDESSIEGDDVDDDGDVGEDDDEDDSDDVDIADDGNVIDDDFHINYTKISKASKRIIDLDASENKDGIDRECGEQSGPEVKEGDSSENQSKYVPPHLRKLEGSNSETQKLERLKKQLKGLINRLSESNMRKIAQDVEEVYANNSRNDTNKVLFKLVSDACVMPTHMPVKMLMEHMMLIAILHTVVGNEVGAFFIQKLVEKFHELHLEEDEYLNGKECDNVLLMIAQLYTFSVIDSLLVYDLIRELVNAFTERDIEMLMLLLRSIGAEIRRDDPGSLKEIILAIQAKAASCSDLMKQTRVRFMLDVITALRNNNLRKIPQYDPSVAENARKQLKIILKNRDSSSDIQLRISLHDLLQAKDKGRWWVVGSAWAGRDGDKDSPGELHFNHSSDNKLVALAKQQRMSTEVRRNIFCVIMSSEDYIDCFEKLLKLNLKDKQAREIVHVLIDCCLQEKVFNPYYAYLAQKLCEYSRSNQVTFQYSFWDRFKLISTSNAHSVENLAKLLSHLLASGALSISILKVVGFATIDKSSIRFFMRLFTILLTEYPESTMKNVFARIAPLQKLSLLREGLKIFLKHFLLSKTAPRIKGSASGRLKELVDMAEAALDGREVVKF